MSQPIVATEGSDLGEVFRSCSRFLFGVSYRLTGSTHDAEDVVQEAFVRALEQPSVGSGESWRRWLTRVVVNLSIDALRRRRRRRYAGPWLPEPLGGTGDPAGEPLPRATPEARYGLRESASFAFLRALEALTPKQRGALILCDVLDYSAADAGQSLGTSEGNARVLLHRARRALRDYDRVPSRPGAELEERTRAALQEFLRCLIQEDPGGLERLLAEGVRTVTDAGGQYTALAEPLVSRRRAVRLFLQVARRRAGGARIEERQVNGLPALLVEFASRVRRQAPRALLRCELDAAGRIAELHVILAREKLAALDRTPGPRVT